MSDEPDTPDPEDEDEEIMLDVHDAVMGVEDNFPNDD